MPEITECKISDLTTAAQVDEGDFVELSQADANVSGGRISLKATILAIANKIANGINFTSALQTTNKTIVGAINEVAQGGGGGGSDVEVTPILTEGTKIATISVDDVDVDLYAENPREVFSDMSEIKSVTGNTVTLTCEEKTCAKSALVTFAPKQDLHGYDAPWIDSDVINKEPYLMRAVSGTATRIGNSLYDKLVGGTVAFNQLVQNGNFVDTSNWSQQRVSLSVSNNVGSVTLTDTTDPYLDQQFASLANHKYLYCAEVKRANSRANARVIAYYNGTSNNKTHTTTTDNWEQAYLIVDNTTASNNRIRITEVDTKTVGDTFSVKNIMVFDLTQMFGSTIADYIYSLEQATAGSGVAYFRSLFPKDYYAYNAGQLMSVKTSAHIMKDASNNVIGNYALDSDLELRGIPKLDANNKLYYDGDTYSASGEVIRNYDEIELSELAWEKVTYSGNVYYQTKASSEYTKGADAIGNIIGYCAVYSLTNVTGLPDNNCITFASTYVGSGKTILVRDDSISSTTELVNKLTDRGKIVFKLITPTTETVDPFTNPQVCDEYGTEEYTDNREVQIPVGHETYQANICKISGWDGLELMVSDGDETEQTYTATFPSTIYGEEYDFVSGEGSSEWGYIASYNGETLPAEWISDRDVYAEGTTPTTGAEVAYKLATPTKIELTPADVELNKGTNVVSTDGDDLSVDYTEIATLDDMKILINTTIGNVLNTEY